MDILSPTPDPSFRRSLVRLSVTSGVLHLLVLAGILSYAARTRVPMIKGPVYTVSLMEVPPGVKAASVGLAPPVTKSLEAPERKEVEAPEDRSLKLPSKEKLAQPKPVSEIARAEAPVPERAEEVPKKKTLVAAVPKSTSPAGGTLSLDAATFPYTYYLRAVEQKISSGWEPVVHGIPRGERREVVVAFRILRDGTIEKPLVEKSSGLSFFDQSALRAVIQAAPLPPLPEGFPEDSLGIHFGFHYTPGG